MTESEWLACTDPKPMLVHLKGVASDRKIRLYLAACCRRIWNALTDERSHTAVEVAERFADGSATEAERIAAVKAAKTAHSECSREKPFAGFPAYAALNTARPHPFKAASECLEAIVVIVADTSLHAALGRSLASNLVFNNTVSQMVARTRKTEIATQAALIRETIGNPFRPVVIDPAWLTSTVKALAEAAYDERLLPAGTLDPDRLSVLADALEDSGCSDPVILDHLRGPGPHCRGCFVLDALLGKE